jgi:hypothetical protein
MCSSETSVDFQRTERRYIPEDNAFNNMLLAAKYLLSRKLNPTFHYQQKKTNTTTNDMMPIRMKSRLEAPIRNHLLFTIHEINESIFASYNAIFIKLTRM